MKNNPTTPRADRAIIRKLVLALFTNAFGDRADRLVLMQEPAGGQKRDLGGWCYQAAVDHLTKMVLPRKKK